MIGNNWNIIYFLNEDGWVYNRVEMGLKMLDIVIKDDIMILINNRNIFI